MVPNKPVLRVRMGAGWFLNKEIMVFLSSFIRNTQYAQTCVIPRNTVAIYPYSYYHQFIFIKLKSGIFCISLFLCKWVHWILDSESNCVFENTVFNIQKDQNQSISMIAKSKGVCQAFILLQSNCASQITHLWTSSKKENVKIYAGINKDRKLILQFK